MELQLFATNRVYEHGRRLPVTVSSPASPTSGALVRFGNLIGVALVDEGDGGNESTDTSVDFGPAVYDVSVKGEDASGNTAVSAGDPVYWTDGNSYLNKNITGYFAGLALEAVSSGATTTIKVLIFPQTTVGGQNLPAGVVVQTDVAADSVGVDELTANLKKGFIPLDLFSAREIFSNDIGAAADGAAQGSGGLLATDTTPALERINGATDKAIRVRWAAGNTDEIQFAPVAMPQDLDAATDITIHLLARMSGATDTPTIDVQVFDGIGDTEMGGATGALSDTLQELTVTIANANVSGHPTGFLNIALVPGAHGTDALDLFAAWIEYTKQD